jgi:type I site-specific restriction endonuclease
MAAAYIPPQMRKLENIEFHPKISLTDRLAIIESKEKNRSEVFFDETEEGLKNLRSACWEALQKDDSDELLNIIKKASEDLKITEDQVMEKLGFWLWRDNSEKKSDRRAMIEVAAGNKKGVPKQKGALRCLEALLNRFPPGISTACTLQEYNRAIFRAERNNRVEALALLKEYRDFAWSELPL